MVIDASMFTSAGMYQPYPVSCTWLPNMVRYYVIWSDWGVLFCHLLQLLLRMLRMHELFFIIRVSVVCMPVICLVDGMHQYFARRCSSILSTPLMSIPCVFLHTCSDSKYTRVALCTFCYVFRFNWRSRCVNWSGSVCLCILVLQIFTGGTPGVCIMIRISMVSVAMRLYVPVLPKVGVIYVPSNLCISKSGVCHHMPVVYR